MFSLIVITIVISPSPIPFDGDTVHHQSLIRAMGYFATNIIEVLFPVDGAEIEVWEMVRTGFSSFEQDIKPIKKATNKIPNFFMIEYSTQPQEWHLLAKRKCGVDCLSSWRFWKNLWTNKQYPTLAGIYI